jgi:hypothetical protein
LLLAAIALLLTLILSSKLIKAAAQPLIELKASQMEKYRYRMSELGKN